MTRHLTDEELMAFLYQDASEGAAEHLQRCPLCQAELKSLHAADDLLGEDLYRLHCPKPEILASYVEGRLGRRAWRATHDHLLQCVPCQREVHALESLATSATAHREQGWLALLAEGVRRIFWAYPSPLPTLQPTRGQDPTLRRYHMRDVDILFSIMPQEDETRRDDKTATIMGQLVPLNDAIQLPFQGTAALGERFDGAAKAPIDDAGGFLLSDVPSGHWQVYIELNPDVIIMMDVDV